MKPRTAAFDALVDTLTAQREVVEYLLFKLVTLKLLFVADERRFLEKAANEVERVIDSLRQAEKHRDAALRVVAGEWDMSTDELTLRRLADETSGETSASVVRLRDAFRTLTDEIEALLEENRALAEGGLSNLRALLDSVADSTGASLYTETGQRHRVLVKPVQLDRVL